MTILLTILHVIVCLVLILVILLQAGRGQGLTGPSFGSGNVQSLFGTGAADFLTKATSVCAILFMITSIALGYIESRKSKSLLNFSQKPSAPVDVDAIKKALDRVKAESAAKGTSAETRAGEAAATVQKTATEAAQTASSGAGQAAESAAKTAGEAAVKAESAASQAAADLPAAPKPSAKP